VVSYATTTVIKRVRSAKANIRGVWGGGGIDSKDAVVRVRKVTLKEPERGSGTQGSSKKVIGVCWGGVKMRLWVGQASNRDGQKDDKMEGAGR